MGGEELDYIHQAFEANWIAPLGENVDGFEDDLTAYTGVNHAAMVTTGTAAIHLGLILLGVEEGDEVICQSFTFAASVNPIHYLNATPILVDSEPDTWNINPDLLEVAIKDRIKKGKKPKAIILVHLYGMPAKMKEIQKIADHYDIPILEDSAEALGSEIDGKKCGSFGKLGVISFNGNKIITTSGGGALLGDDEELIEGARFYATQARGNALHYQHSQIGYNYRMSNILAGIGRGQMKVLSDRIKARRDIHAYYFEKLGGKWLGESSNEEVLGANGKGIYFLKEPKGFKSNRWLTTIIVKPAQDNGVTSENIRQALEDENIESRPLWKPMQLQPVFSEHPFYHSGVSEEIFNYGLCLPSGSNITDEEKERIVKTILKLYD